MKVRFLFLPQSLALGEELGKSASTGPLPRALAKADACMDWHACRSVPRPSLAETHLLEIARKTEPQLLPTTTMSNKEAAPAARSARTRGPSAQTHRNRAKGACIEPATRRLGPYPPSPRRCQNHRGLFWYTPE